MVSAVLTPDTLSVSRRDHIPVLAEPAVSALITDPAGTYVDGTVGLGGHALRIAGRLEDPGRLIAVDRDEAALTEAKKRLKFFGERVTFFRDNFRNVPLILNRLGIAKIHGLLLDLGVSSLQLDDPERGFSFQSDGPLDMRMDRSRKTCAADLVNGLSESELADLFFHLGEERRSRAIARRIAEARSVRRLNSTLELASLVESVIGRPPNSRIHPATRVFQALRIAVNEELERLGEFLEEAAGVLVSGGRLVVISFHSLEDRIVKNTFRRLEGRCVCRMPAGLCKCPRTAQARVLTRKPREADEDEVARNPRCRSARMRVLEMLPR